MAVVNTFGNNKYDWTDIDSDNVTEVSSILQKYEINNEIAAYSLDRNEKAHVEYDDISGTFLLIYNVPYVQKIDNHYETGPLTFIIKDNHLITIGSSETKHIIALIEKHLKSKPDISIFMFLFGSLFLIADAFSPLVDSADKETKLVNRKLRDRTTKKNILELSDLEIGLIYLVMASKQNAVLLEQTKALSIYHKLSAHEKEELDDALIEAKQLVDMTQIISQILQQLSDTYNNLLNNNLNDIIRVLTVLSILLAVPTIVVGFFGMNMPLPLEHNRFGWIISILISLVLWAGLAFVLHRILRGNNK